MKLAKFKTVKSFLKGQSRSAGRNNQGKLTVRHQGAGHKQQFRSINWVRENMEDIVINLEYDPNRTAFLAKLCTGVNIDEKNNKVVSKKELSFSNFLTEQNSFSYILAPKGLKIFDKLQTIKEKVNNISLQTGDISVLSNFEVGNFIHAIESFPGKGPVFAKAAGNGGQVLQHFSSEYAKIEFSSGTERLISLNAKATLGKLGREDFYKIKLYKAGQNRWLNKRPSVRGVAMNPIDHPHGGGQGKTKGGRPSVTPSSRPTKGQPTRSKRKKNILILNTRKKK